MRVLIAVLVAFGCYLQYALWFTPGGIRDVRKLEQAVAEAEQENALLRDRNQALAAEVIDLKQGLDAIEERARSDMGKIKEGEVFFRMTEPPLNPPVEGAVPPIAIQARPRPSTEGAAEGIPAADLDPLGLPAADPAAELAPEPKIVAPIKSDPAP
jgi:cell division protein FtsB